jgi:hypothetical protein
VTRLVVFDFWRASGVFYHIGIVSERLPGAFPHCRRKTGFPAFPGILAALASQGYDASGGFMRR